MHVSEIITKIESGDTTNPSEDSYGEALEYICKQLIADGTPAGSAMRLARTLYWYGWNQGWIKGYNDRQERVDTS